MINILIGLTGAARSGKDSAALCLRHIGFKQVAFADPIRDGLLAMMAPLGLRREQLDGAAKEAPLAVLQRSPRELMQTLGTEWGRQRVRDDVWLRLAEAEVTRWREQCLGRGAEVCGVVVSDVRFANEAAFIRNQGGVVVHLQRPGVSPVRAHASEAGVTFVEGADLVLRNDGCLGELDRKICEIALAQIDVLGCA